MAISKYDQFHNKAKLQKRIVKGTNFTYFYLLSVIDGVLKKSFCKKALDVGCGTGTISLYLANRGLSVDGVDISKLAIKSAKKNSDNFNLSRKTNFVIKDIQKGEINGSYDLIVISEVLEHLKNDNKVLLNLIKLLKKNGKIIISVPSANAPLFKLGLLKKFDKQVGHLRRYSKNELMDKITKSGFTVIKSFKTESIIRNLLFTVKEFGFLIKFIRGPITYLAILIDKFFTVLFGESQVIVTATKK